MMAVHVYNEAGYRYLWGDTPDEALIVAAAIGHDLTQPPWTWGCYALTEDQWIDAMIAGATPTNKFGPAYWCAAQRGDHKMLTAITRARTMGCA